MSDQESLQDLLAGSSAFNPAVAAKIVSTETEPEVKAEAVPVKTEAKAEVVETEPTEVKTDEVARDQQGRFQKTVPQEALHAERQKRQALEQRLAEMQTQKAPPSVLEDEDGAFNARISQATAPLQAKLFKLSVKAASQVSGREDFQDVTSAFLEAADKDPQLMKSFREADDPGEYAYSVGKQIKELSDVNGDIVAYGEKKSAAVKAELDKANEKIKLLEAEVAAKAANKAALEDVPRSLNGNASAAPKSVTETDDEPLSAITRFNKRG